MDRLIPLPLVTVPEYMFIFTVYVNVLTTGPILF